MVRSNKVLIKILTIPLFFFICLIYYKNSQIIVCGTNGMRFYELYITNIANANRDEDTYIGWLLGNSTNIAYQKEQPGWENRIDKIEVINNNIIFHRPEKGNYVIKKWFLFWKLEIGDTFYSFEQ